MKVFLVANSAWSLINFRSGLMRTLLLEGYDLTAVAPFDIHAARISELGVNFIPMPMDNKGTNPFRDVNLLLRFWILFNRERPNIIFSYTIKPVIYASLAARLLNIPAVSVITGLGSVFLNESFLKQLVEVLYRISQYKVLRIFFLNNDDMQVFRERKLAPENVMKNLRSEGIDLRYFKADVPQHSFANPSLVRNYSFRFLLMARMIWDKGIGEYVEAARRVRLLHPGVEFCLLGFLDVENPSAISRMQIDGWVKEGVVHYLGVMDDVREAVSRADCIVLPSYREGVSRTLLEAAAMGRPIVTTNCVGCRDVVDDGVNGYLCLPKDAEDLARKMIKIIELSPEALHAMGVQGRKKVENEFDERFVISCYTEVIKDLDSTNPAR